MRKVWASLLMAACGGQEAVPQGNDPISVESPVIVQPVLDDVAAMYLTINNDGTQPDTLVSVSTGVAGRAEFHRQMADGAMVSMEPVAEVVIPGGEGKSLEPGGLHIMLQELTRAPAAGDTIEVILTFRRAGDIALRVPVVTYGDLQ